jgi:two-component system chemotaxis response regulator CheB
VVRVMVVDDSAVIRGLTKRMLEAESTISVVSSVGDGEQAVRAIKRLDVDVVVLDIEMPRMDGLTALPLLIKEKPELRVIMSSTLTTRNADISLQALSKGAADYIPKPTSTRDIHSSDEFRNTLIEKVQVLGKSAQRSRARKAGPSLSAYAVRKTAAARSEISLRKVGLLSPDILAIGSSTGGPQALFEFFKAVDPQFSLPIIITQHMPATFTKILAAHIETIGNRPCVEAQGGEVITKGHVYVAPGGKHMLLKNNGPRVVVELSDSPPENYCQPSVDPMLRSAIKIYGSRILTVIFTGMGQDGLKGCENVVAAGGTVVGQDEDTSVVWGRPGAVATHGLCSAVLPLGEIAGYVSGFPKRIAA